MEPPLFRLLILALLVLASGLLTLSGAALSLSRKPRLKLKGACSKSPGAALEAAERPEPYLSGLRIWNLVVRLSAGFACFAPEPPAPLLFILIVLAFIAFSELLPWALAGYNPEGILLAVFPASRALCLFWKPLYELASSPFRPRGARSGGEEEFRIALDEGEKSGAVESSERSMVEGVLYLGDRPAGAFMTHRSEIQCLDIGASSGEARSKALEFRAQGFFPVVRETQDDIAGFVSVEDILIAGTAENWKGLAAFMKVPHFIPETMSALKAFEAFRREEEDFLCVMDEYGGFAGTLRIRDLVEEIVGELTGSVPGEEAVIRLEDGSWLAGGSVNIDDLAKSLGVDALDGPEGNYHTLAGFILKLAGDIPRTGERFDWGAFRFTVADLDGNRIDKVLITKSG